MLDNEYHHGPRGMSVRQELLSLWHWPERLAPGRIAYGLNRNLADRVCSVNIFTIPFIKTTPFVLLIRRKVGALLAHVRTNGPTQPATHQDPSIQDIRVRGSPTA